MDKAGCRASSVKRRTNGRDGTLSIDLAAEDERTFTVSDCGVVRSGTFV